MSLAHNHHRLALVAHGTAKEGRAVIEHAPEHFLDALGELLEHIDRTGAFPERLRPHLQLLTHPEATHEDKKKVIQEGAGFMDFIKGVGKGIHDVVDTASSVANAAAPIVEKVAPIALAAAAL